TRQNPCKPRASNPYLLTRCDKTRRNPSARRVRNGSAAKEARPSMKFTQRRIEELACPLGRKDVLKFDAHLGVRVTMAAEKGSLAGKFYLAQYSVAGVKRRVPLGSCDAISLAAAREATKAILGEVAKGRDPAADRKHAALNAKSRAAHDALSLE